MFCADGQRFEGQLIKNKQKFYPDGLIGSLKDLSDYLKQHNMKGKVTISLVEDNS